MFDRLMTLPLFKGVTLQRMTDTVGKAKFHFLKFLPGQKFIKAGDDCTHLTFILSGSARVTIANSDSRFRVIQTLNGPDVIYPDYLFGRHTFYPCDVEAIDAVNILQVSKKDYLNILKSDEIFMINYFNYLSTNAQKTIDGVMSITFGEIEERIALWIACLTQTGATDIVLAARQRDLCSVFGMQRATFNAGIQHMVDKGLIESFPNEIRIKDRAEVVRLLSGPMTED